MKKFIVLFLCAAVLPLFAQKVGTSSYQFLKVMPSARGVGMADAYSSLASGSDAVFWNPAGLVTVQSQDVATNMVFWLVDTRQTSLSYAYSLPGIGTVGAQFQYVDYGEMFETRVDQLAFVTSGNTAAFNPGLTGRTFNPHAWVAGVSFARSLTLNFSTGVTLKYVKESLFNGSQVTYVNELGRSESYGTTSGTLLFDFGMLYNTGYRSIKLGVAIQNFGSSVKYAKEAYPAPLAFRLGASADLIGVSPIIMPDADNRLTASYDIFQPNDYSQQMHFGLEYSFMEWFFARAGYKLDYDYEKFSFGAGAAKLVAGYQLKFDYAYGAMGGLLGNVHRLSLGVVLP